MMMGENKTYFLAKQHHQKKGERSRPLRSDNSPFIICQEIRPLLLMEHIAQCDKKFYFQQWMAVVVA